MCSGPSWRGCSRPAAQSRSRSALTVFSWNWNTRVDLSAVSSLRQRFGSWVATPVGQRSVWQLSDWMQPSANMKPRAALHQSAPIAMVRAMSKALRSEEHTSELQSLMRISYAVFCLKKKKHNKHHTQRE